MAYFFLGLPLTGEELLGRVGNLVKSAAGRDAGDGQRRGARVDRQCCLADAGLLREQAARNVSLDTCHALQFHLTPHENEVSRGVIIWRGSRADFRLVRRERLRDVRAGDEVIYQWQAERVPDVF